MKIFLNNQLVDAEKAKYPFLITGSYMVMVFSKEFACTISVSLNWKNT